MNNTKLILALFLFGMVWVRGEEPAKYTPESRTVMETFTSKILKVYAFQEGECEYVSYVVNWQDHEVVVTPGVRIAGEAKLKEGDEIRCSMVQTNHRVGEANKTRISFYVTANREVMDLADVKRLEEVAAEVKSRREKRQAAMNGNSKLIVAATPSGSAKSATVSSAEADAVVEIQIRANGDVVIDKVVMSSDALKETLSAIAKQDRQRPVYIVVNEKAPVESVTKVMDQCRKLGLQKFSMATGPNE